MKKAFIFSFFVLGISSIISQVIVIRELMVSFYGNEFFIGWVLFGWLFWSGVGSLFLGKFFKKEKTANIAFPACHIIVAIALPVEILLIRFGRFFLSATPGAVPNLIPALIYAFFVVAPFCLILGFQFAVAARSIIFQNQEVQSEVLIGRSYFWETLGFITGGILFSYWFVSVNEFLSASFLAAINLLSAFFLVEFFKKFSWARRGVFLIASFAVVAILYFNSDMLNQRTSELKFSNEKLLSVTNSIHGNLTVTQTGDQFNLYENGLHLVSSEKEVFNEVLVHFPMLEHPNPKRVLVLGGGLNGVLEEILKHKPEEVTYIELDPEIIQLTKKYFPKNFTEVLGDKRIKIFHGDARYYLGKNSDVFDVILINLPNPSTALINRFYTREFFKLIKGRLSSSGVTTTHLTFSANYLSQELKNLSASIYKTFSNIFQNVLILPEDSIFFIGSSRGLITDPQLLIQRYTERAIQTDFISPPFINYRLTNDRVQSVRTALNEDKSVRMNQDLKPYGYYYNLIYWVSFFYLNLAESFSDLLQIPFYAAVLVLLFLVLVPVLTRRGAVAKTRTVLLIAMGMGGFSLMSAEVILIYLYQIFYGNLYYKIAWIVSVFMAGMGVGIWLASRRAVRAVFNRLMIIYLLEVFYFAFMLFVVWILFQNPANSTKSAEIIFLASAVFIGALVGYEFPYVNKLFFSDDIDLKSKTGLIYSADLFGSCLGAFLISVFMIPIFGIYQTILFILFVNILLTFLVFLTSVSPQKLQQ